MLGHKWKSKRCIHIWLGFLNFIFEAASLGHACAILIGLFILLSSVLLGVVSFRTEHVYSKFSHAAFRRSCLSVHVTLHWRKAEVQQCTFVWLNHKNASSHLGFLHPREGTCCIFFSEHQCGIKGTVWCSVFCKKRAEKTYFTRNPIKKLGVFQTIFEKQQCCYYTW